MGTDEEFQILIAKTPASGVHCNFPCGYEDVQPMKDEAVADHVFYFTLRDSNLFSKSEDFGIISRCGSKKCKFQRSIIHPVLHDVPFAENVEQEKASSPVSQEAHSSVAVYDSDGNG